MSSGKLWGQTTLNVDGQYLQTEGKGSIEVGGFVATAVDGDNQAGFYTEQMQGSVIEVMVLMTGDVSLAYLQALRGVTVHHQCDSGQLYVVSNAFTADKVSASEGKAKLKLCGPQATEFLS
jgi:hypothetical protein